MRQRNLHPSGSRKSVSRQVAGFTLVELSVAVAVISLLMVLILPALAKAQSKMRSNRCLSNLQDVGTAMGLYLQDSNDKLPYAALRYTTGSEEHHLAWDDLMGPYLGIDLTLAQRKQDGASNAGSLKLLSCPLDAVPVKLENGVDRKETRRSYAMPEHNLGLNTLAGRAATAADWPPNPVNQTGLGIRLDGRPNHLSSRWNSDDEPGGKTVPRWQAAFQVNMILSPASTLFMTEQFDGGNRAGAWAGASISDISAHQSKDSSLLQPQINYLMIEGHVESLTPAKTYGTAGKLGTAPTGIWTIWQDD
ncbi:MAG: hypothetical protein K0Q55_469 [Verrucomicrobia bacterium]|jgi:prepilin-type N-terminal cleavage/methylation domain-containing protein|nr:hypothetical protein [Verrucomicrobiota bacterium]